MAESWVEGTSHVVEIEILLNHGVIFGSQLHKFSAGYRLGVWMAVHRPRSEYLFVGSRITLDPLGAVKSKNCMVY